MSNQPDADKIRAWFKEENGKMVPVPPQTQADHDIGARAAATGIRHQQYLAWIADKLEEIEYETNESSTHEQLHDLITQIRRKAGHI